MSRRCLIPAAGRGTRLRPITRTVPKELLPIGTRPMIQWAITEALEGGFDELGLVTRETKPLLTSYLTGDGWREGLRPELAAAAESVVIRIFLQEEPRGVVDAVLTASDWLREGSPMALLLPDNVRLAGSVPLTASLLDRAQAAGPVAACHRVGPELERYFGDVGRAVLEDLVPAGRAPRVVALEPRGKGSFEAPAEGAWRLLPRYVVTGEWLEEARRVARDARAQNREADDVEVHRRLVERGALGAIPWEGTIVDAGHPAGYLYAQHVLHEAERESRAREDDGPPLLQIGGA
ncbi:MAG: sugar phosphate nucleotidyltransferase [Gemmatimonadota bacterium]